MKTFNKKKGFTIVELVIVIAVIGVLTAILVPTFVNLTNKANDAADQSLVKNLNTQLRMKEQTEGKNATLTDALEDAKEGGYLVENLTPRGSRDIVWNQDKDEFSLLEGAPAENAYKFWKIYEKAEDVPSTQTYSIFAKGNKWTTVPTLAVGFDAGENEGIEVLNFETTAAVNAIIRTNGTGTVLNVNAANASVHHYDVLDSLTITAIYGESYHEHGTVKGKAVISQGHIEIEEGASVSQVSVENATGAVKVTANEGTLVTADATSSAQTSVVANSDEVFVSGVDAEKISGSQSEKVETPTAVINETQLEAAFAGKKAFIQLGADFNAAAAHINTVNAVFDFAGHTITSSLLNEALITNESTLRFVDSLSEGGIESANNNVVINHDKMVIDGGRFAGNRVLTSTEEQSVERGVVYNAEGATLVVNDIDLYIKADYGLLNYGNMTVNGGDYLSDADSSAFASARYGYCITSNGGHMTLNNANVSGIHGCISVGGGDAIINDAHAETRKGTTAKTSPFRALYIAGEVEAANVEIRGGYYKSVTMEAILTGNNSDGGVGAYASSTIFGGTFINGKGGTNPAIKVANTTTWSYYGLGSTKIYGGSFSSDVSGAIGVETCVQGEDGLWVVNA